MNWNHQLQYKVNLEVFGEDPPHTNSIKRWFKKFMETGRTLGAKLSIALTYWEQQMEHMLKSINSMKKQILEIWLLLKLLQIF